MTLTNGRLAIIATGLLALVAALLVAAAVVDHAAAQAAGDGMTTLAGYRRP